MRTIILDLITAEYVSAILSNNLGEVNKILERIYYDHYKFEKNLVKRDRSIHSNDPSFLQKLEEFVKNKDKYLDENGVTKKHLNEKSGIIDKEKIIISKLDITNPKDKAIKKIITSLVDDYSTQLNIWLVNCEFHVKPSDELVDE